VATRFEKFVHPVQTHCLAGGGGWGGIFNATSFLAGLKYFIMQLTRQDVHIEG